MSKKQLIYFSMVLILIFSVLTGCGGKKEFDISNVSNVNPDNEKGTTVDQVLNMSLGAEPDSLDVAKASDAYSAFVLEQIVEPLTRLELDNNGDRVHIPAAAQSWDHSEDQLEWTFKLRDAKWSDGKDLTAEDFVYGIHRTLDPETASPISSHLKHIKNAESIAAGEMDLTEAGVEAIDSKTIKFTLEHPTPHFLDTVEGRAMQPQRQDIIELHGNAYGTEADKLVFCGPFILDEWVHGSKVVLTKNDTYWDKDSVKLDTVNLKIISEITAAMGEFQNSTLDIAEVNNAEWIAKLDSENKYDKMTGFLPRTNYFFFNQEDKLFSNTKVRQAFSVALNREEIQIDLLQDIDKAGYGWIAPPVEIDGKNFRELAGDPVKELIEENPDPKSLLIEGLKELGLDEDPSKHTVTMMQPGIGLKEFGEYLQQSFGSTLGINLELDPVEWPVFQERNRQLDYEIGYKSYGGGHNDPSALLDLWITGNKIVPVGWSNLEYDRLVNEASLSLDQDLRLANYKEAERLIVKDDCIIAPYSYQTKNTYMHKHVKGIMEPPFGSLVIKYVYIEK